jgi:hypothetical protein
VSREICLRCNSEKVAANGVMIVSREHLDALRAQLADQGEMATGYRSKWLSEEQRRFAAERERDEARRERDLAAAHDRQPYPTAEAYEKVCAARTKWQERAEALASLLLECADSMEARPEDPGLQTMAKAARSAAAQAGEG